jgi:hypothetical protein
MAPVKVTRLRLGKGDKQNEWCELQVELRETDKGPELSICGAAGRELRAGNDAGAVDAAGVEP